MQLVLGRQNPELFRVAPVPQIWPEVSRIAVVLQEVSDSDTVSVIPYLPPATSSN